MSEYVARLEWSGHDLASGATEGGVLWVGLDDVVIIPREVTKGQRMMTERMAARGPHHRLTEAEVQEIIREVESDPNANEVVETFYSKAIPLPGAYHFAYVEHPERDLTGFGFSAGIGPVERKPAGCGLTFSWEWFNVNEPGKGLKIQEAGSILIHADRDRVRTRNRPYDL